MRRVLICGLLVGGLMLGSACDSEPPTAPGPTPPPPTVTEPPAPPPAPPPLPTGNLVATYAYSGALDYAVQVVTTQSEYLLYDNGVFGLRYEAIPYVYTGTYLQDGETITFRFSGDVATGTLKGDLLEVRYSERMQHSDFENAVYKRAQ